VTHDEMIAVIAAHRDGAKIECREVFGDDGWGPSSTPMWNFAERVYRVATIKWRDAMIDDLKRAPVKCRVRAANDKEWIESRLIGHSLGSNTRWRTHDFFWHAHCQVIDE